MWLGIILVTSGCATGGKGAVKEDEVARESPNRVLNFDWPAGTQARLTIESPGESPTELTIVSRWDTTEGGTFEILAPPEQRGSLEGGVVAVLSVDADGRCYGAELAPALKDGAAGGFPFGHPTPGGSPDAQANFSGLMGMMAALGDAMTGRARQLWWYAIGQWPLRWFGEGPIHHDETSLRAPLLAPLEALARMLGDDFPEVKIRVTQQIMGEVPCPEGVDGVCERYEADIVPDDEDLAAMIGALQAASPDGTTQVTLDPALTAGQHVNVIALKEGMLPLEVEIRSTAQAMDPTRPEAGPTAQTKIERLSLRYGPEKSALEEAMEAP